MEPTRSARPLPWQSLAALGLLVLLATACASANETAMVAAVEAATESTDVTSAAPPSTAPTTSVTTTEAPGEGPEALAAAEAIGDRFMQARDDHDGATLVSLLAPDATFGGFELAQTLDEYPMQIEWERVMGWQFLDSNCSASSPDRVSCSYSVLEAFNDEAGNPPYPGSVILLELNGDQMIQRVSNNFNPDEDFYKEAEFNFLLWLRENHPGDSERMYDDRPFLVKPPVLTPEVIQLFEERASEYLAPEPRPVAGQAAVLGDALGSVNEAVGLPAPTIEGFDYLSAEPVNWGGDGPAAVLFAPLADWCPHCSIHLEQLTSTLR